MSSPYGKKDKKDPQADITILNKVISDGDFKPVHILFGQEDYLRFQFRDKLCEAMGGVKGSLAFDRFIGPDTDPERIVDLAETLPFMAERRVILIEDTKWFTDAKDSLQVLEDYFERGVCESTSIVFCEKNADKRLRFYKAAAKNALISEFPVQTVETLKRWISSRCREAGTPVGSSDAEYLISVVGTDMLTLANETEKLLAYCMDDGTVSRAAIDTVCTRRLEDRVFDLCEAVAYKNRRKAMTLYYDLVALDESPVKIVVLVTRQFETLIRIKDLENRGYRDGAIAEKVGKREWTIKGYRNQAERYAMSDLISIVNMCADTDAGIKSGKIGPNTALETLMVSLTNM